MTDLAFPSADDFYKEGYERLRRLSDAASAMPCFQKACEYAPKNPTYPYFLGKSLVGLGRLDEARKAFRRALKLAQAGNVDVIMRFASENLQALDMESAA